jgi:hypothetical protein
MQQSAGASTDPGQLLSNEHVYDPAGTQYCAQNHPSRVGVCDPTDGYCFAPMLVRTKGFQRGLCHFRRNDGYHLALVGHV